jgi:hypothetical protein
MYCNCLHESTFTNIITLAISFCNTGILLKFFIIRLLHANKHIILDKTSNLAQAGSLLLVLNIAWLAPSIAGLDLSQGERLSNLVSWGILLLVAGLLFPALALGFYYHPMVKAAFTEHDPKLNWTERYPFPLLAVLLLLVIIIIVLHLAIFFQGLFPLFGSILLGRPSAYIISLSVLIAGILIYGLVRLKQWAWWGALGYTAALALSSLLTFSRYTFTAILDRMKLPAFELALLDRLTPLQDFSLVLLTSVPLLAACGLLVYSKRYFGKRWGTS